MPLPNSGYITINSFLIKSQEPVLVDTGMRVEASEWMEALKSVIDPEDIRWIWITHDDADHTGSVEEVLTRENIAQVYGVDSLVKISEIGVTVISLSRIGEHHP